MTESENLLTAEEIENIVSSIFDEPLIIDDYVDLIRQWHHDRNLIEGANDKDQVCKLIQEVGELSDNVCKGNDIRDDIGDCIVVLVNIAERNGVSILECVEQAYNDIKDRKGMMVDGIFVKEDDGIVPAHNEEATSSYYSEQWDPELQIELDLTQEEIEHYRSMSQDVARESLDD